MPRVAVTSAGFDALQYSRRSSAGVLVGAANLTPTTDDGESSGMARYNGALSASITLPTPTEVNILGDDTRLAVYQFDGVNPVAFDVEMSVHDFAFKQAAEGVSYVTEAEEVMMPIGATGLTRNGLIVLFTSQAKSYDSGSLNVAGFSHVLLFNTEWTDLGRGHAHQAANTRRWRVTANMSDTLPDGRLISTVFPTVPGGQAVGFEFTSTNRVSYAAIMGDATETDIITPYKPVSVETSKATVETTGFAAATVSSVDVTDPYGIVLSAAPGAGKLAVSRYEFQNYE
jgi:hypothetical protein